MHSAQYNTGLPKFPPLFQKNSGKPPTSSEAGGFPLPGRAVASGDRDDFPAQLLGGDVRIVVMLALIRYRADRDRVPRAVLQAAEALDAVAADHSAPVLDPDVAARTQTGALPAADAAHAHLEGGGFFPGDQRPGLVFGRVQRVLRRGLRIQPAGQHILRDLAGELFAALLCFLRAERGDHQGMGEEPDAAALVRDRPLRYWRTD